MGNTYFIGDNISIDTVRSIINDKESVILYILNSESSNDYNNDISYSGNVDNEEYNNLLNILGVDSELFDVPAIIYIREGVMFANIININDMNIVDRFVNDYDLMFF